MLKELSNVKKLPVQPKSTTGLVPDVGPPKTNINTASLQGESADIQTEAPDKILADNELWV